MILVTGAAGKTGRAIIAELAVQGVEVHAFVHRPAQVALVQDAGAEATTVGSFQDGPTLVKACGSCTAVYHISPNASAHELRHAEAVIVAAQHCGIRRFVYHSVLHPQIEAMPHHWAKMRVEERLWASGFDLTVLQPTAYMQNLAAIWADIMQRGILQVPYPALTRLSLVDLDDVAEAAAVVLTEQGHIGATYELCGTPALTQREVAATLGVVLARRIRVQSETPEAWEQRARARGMGEYERGILTAMFRHYAAHGLIGSPNTLRWLLRRAPTTLDEFARRLTTDQA